MPARVPRAEGLPGYDPLLRAFHRAFNRELTRAVEDLPLAPDARALDVPCGDGYYTRRLARRLFPAGRVTAADLSPAYLRRARRAVARGGRCRPVEFRRADVYELPFRDAEFDFAWCAQSFVSLQDPARALAELRRVVRPGGLVAVLESDEYHHVLLPWPVDLEVSLQQALRAASRARYGRSAKLAPARRIGRMCAQAGLEFLRKRTYAADRRSPFGPRVRRFLELHLAFIRGLVKGFLTRRERRRLERFCDPAAEGSLFRQPAPELTCLTAVYLARRPWVGGEPQEGNNSPA
jgi:ubiquinone/menaquinone biosynthesis C-methylase UbiE